MRELRDPPQQAIAQGRSEVLSVWAESLRTACHAIGQAAESGLSTIAVVGSLRGGATEGRLLRALSRELAVEYGLEESVTLEGISFAARFSRSVPPPLRDTR